jgi:hypothetical protein
MENNDQAIQHYATKYLSGKLASENPIKSTLKQYLQSMEQTHNHEFIRLKCKELLQEKEYPTFLTDEFADENNNQESINYPDLENTLPTNSIEWHVNSWKRKMTEMTDKVFEIKTPLSINDIQERDSLVKEARSFMITSINSYKDFHERMSTSIIKSYLDEEEKRTLNMQEYTKQNQEVILQKRILQEDVKQYVETVNKLKRKMVDHQNRFSHYMKYGEENEIKEISNKLEIIEKKFSFDKVDNDIPSSSSSNVVSSTTSLTALSSSLSVDVSNTTV